MKLKTKFQDEDFKLGEVVDAHIYHGSIKQGIKVVADAASGGEHTFYYDSIKEFTDHWEDAPKEPKEYWTVSCGMAIKYNWYDDEFDRATESVGLKFDTREECERAIEKMKAWRRLNNKGFKFDGWKRDERYYGDFTITASDEISCDDKDLDLLFGGEE